MRRYVPHLVLAAVVLAAALVSAFLTFRIPLPDASTDYNTAGFVVRHSWVKYAQLASEPFREELSKSEQTSLLARFFELNASIAEHERVAGDAATSPAERERAFAAAGAARAERSRIENRAELTLEARLTAVADDLGLTREIGHEIVWPPVDIEFEPPPAVLVRSPRSEIRRLADRLVDGGLPVEEKARLEAEAEASGETSALVVQIGAIAMYPSVIPPRQDYRDTLETIAHEWVHHYLFFAPLGRRYYDSDRLLTLNETVANVAGAEIGAQLFERYPLEEAPAYVSAAPVSRAAGARAGAAFEFGREMRALRLDVDALLAAGRVADAEALMEARRAVFAENGFYIRRLNQAYFAFHGSYADTPASSDPIGPKVEALRAQELSLKAFLEAAREFRSEDSLDAALR